MNGAEDTRGNSRRSIRRSISCRNQFDNNYNMVAHYETTAEEIWKDTKGEITHFVAGLGTSGTAVGVSRKLREYNPNVKIIAVAPDPSTPIQGLKNFNTQYVPRIWEPERVDEIHYVKLREGEESSRLLALGEGIFVGPSSGAAFHVALKKAKEIDGGVMVVMAPDGGEKYLSTSLCEPSQCLECAMKYGINCSYSDGRPIVEARLLHPSMCHRELCSHPHCYAIVISTLRLQISSKGSAPNA